MREENLGTYNGIVFKISTGLALGAYQLDQRLPVAVQPHTCAQTFVELFAKHSVREVVFSWDMRFRAREIFFCLAEGFDSFRSTESPCEIARQMAEVKP